jgi:hypothetical protein
MNSLNLNELTVLSGGDNPFRVAAAWYRGFMNGLFNTDSGFGCDSENKVIKSK